MKYLLICLSLVLSSSAHANDWLTVVGDMDDAASDTVQVDPRPVNVHGDNRSMRIQVNRGSPRKNWDGVPYRSYQALVEFNCLNNEAWFQQVVYFMRPYWSGTSHKSIEFTLANRRPMRFRDMTPNPMERIIKAACATSRVTPGQS